MKQREEHAPNRGPGTGYINGGVLLLYYFTSSRLMGESSGYCSLVQTRLVVLYSCHRIPICCMRVYKSKYDVVYDYYIIEANIPAYWTHATRLTINTILLLIRNRHSTIASYPRGLIPSPPIVSRGGRGRPDAGMRRQETMERAWAVDLFAY